MVKTIILAILMMIPAAIAAQTVSYTTVTGTITDSASTPYANGTVLIKFVDVAGQQSTLGSGPGSNIFQRTYVVPLDSNGSFTQSLPANSSFFPPGTQWSFTVSSMWGYGSASANITISGTSQSVTSNLSNLARISWPAGSLDPPGGSNQQIVAIGSGLFGWQATGLGQPLQGVTFNPSVGNALILCNNQAILTLNSCGTTGGLFQIAADGSLTISADVGGAPKTTLYMNTTGDLRLFTSFAPDAVGFATDHNNNLCISTGQPVTSNHDCTDSHVWEWNTSGRLAKVVGQTVCLNANAGCGHFPSPCWGAGISIGLTLNISNTLLITTGSNSDTNSAPCNGGLYEFKYWLRATTTVASNNVQITLTCIDEGGATQNILSPSFSFSSAGAVAQGSLFCFSNPNQPIKVSYTNTGGASVPTYDAKGSLWYD